MSEMDAAGRLDAFANHWQAAMDDDLVSDVIAVIDGMALRKGDLRAVLDELEQLRAERDEFCRQRNEWVSDMHAAFAAGLEAPRPVTSGQSWRLSQDWIAGRAAERQAARSEGNTL